MGGGIAYQSASKGTPIIMKDIKDEQLDLGMGEANKLLGKLVKREKITSAKAGDILADIRPTLNYGDFGNVDIVVEAVVENPKVKKFVLAEVEAALDDVNLHRFLDLVHEFRQEAQLLIVSHQKRTMEAADCLYGITMQPGGSSRAVSEKVSVSADR